MSLPPLPPLTSVERLEESLDPENWEAFRSIAHDMLDEVIDSQRDIGQKPAWQPLPEAIEKRFKEAAPDEGQGLAAACQDFIDLVLPYPTGNAHPRFWGWVTGTGSPSGMLAEMFAGACNSNAGLFNDAATRVERQVLDWMRSSLELPSNMSGAITGGGSEANLVGLAAARDAMSRVDVPRWGLHGEAGLQKEALQGDRAQAVASETAEVAGPLVLYASKEVHSSILKAAQILGLGSEAVRLISVDGNFRIRLPELVAAIQHDRLLGYRPFAIVGNAGTVNTGAVDDLGALADLAGRESLWLHVDGAFGALTRLTPSHANLVAGLERADSVAFDFHKWLYVPYEAGGVFVRELENHRKPFTVLASYLEPLERGVSAISDSASLRGLQLSRGFKALKVWLLVKEHGFARYGRLIERNIHQARYLAGAIEALPELELQAPVPMNIVCFRYLPKTSLSLEAQNGLNREILMCLQEQGLAVPSGTVLGGHFSIRVAITNQRSSLDDFDFLVEQVLRLGRELSGS